MPANTADSPRSSPRETFYGSDTFLAGRRREEKAVFAGKELFFSVIIIFCQLIVKYRRTAQNCNLQLFRIFFFDSRVFFTLLAESLRSFLDKSGKRKAKRQGMHF